MNEIFISDAEEAALTYLLLTLVLSLTFTLSLALTPVSFPLFTLSFLSPAFTVSLSLSFSFSIL